MRKIVLICCYNIVTFSALSQVLQTEIVGDSIRLHNNLNSTELILENSTRNVNGFLHNKGNGRTEFRSIATVPGTGWALTGNAGTNPDSNFIGTTDNSHLYFRTNNSIAGYFSSNGWPKLQVNGPIASLGNATVQGINPYLALMGDEVSYYPAVHFSTRNVGFYE
ncbi:MAG: hypothetical protein ABR502_09510, partial [Chitinophagaceae bacterium]